MPCCGSPPGSSCSSSPPGGKGSTTIAGWLGVATYPPAILFAIATLFIIVVLLHYSTVLSHLDDQNTLLAQRLALLEQRVDEATGSDGSLRPDP